MICFAADSSCDWRGEAGTNFIMVHREMEPPPVGTETPEFERKLQRDHHNREPSCDVTRLKNKNKPLILSRSLNSGFKNCIGNCFFKKIVFENYFLGTLSATNISSHYSEEKEDVYILRTANKILIRWQTPPTTAFLSENNPAFVSQDHPF